MYLALQHRILSLEPMVYQSKKVSSQQQTCTYEEGKKEHVWLDSQEDHRAKFVGKKKCLDETVTLDFMEDSRCDMERNRDEVSRKTVENYI